ncbi:MAG: TonB-dependent receptor [Bacteroidia bacterium]|nr:TonB-dependent receptor [Bacteroidia bacterium]
MVKRLCVAALIVLSFGSISNLWAQDVTITGVVTDAQFHQPLPGVAVVQEEQNVVVVTDFDGNYTIKCSTANNTLSFRYLGMRTEVREYDASTTKIDVEMRDDSQDMEEIVVVAYGVRKKGTITGSVSTISNDKIADTPTASFDQALQGKAAGLTVMSNSGEPSQTATFQIRGTNSINSGTAPLFILDGVPVSASDFNALSPGDIESVNVLKDASSTSIYGARAANGVVVITTKRGLSMDDVKVTVRGQRGISQLAQGKWHLMNTAERIEFEKEVGIDAGQNYAQLSKTDVNWRDIVFNDDAMLQSYEVQVNKATDKLHYYVSGGFFDQNGIAHSSKFRRYNTRVNADVKTSDKLKIGTNTMLAYEEVQQAEDGQYALYSPISACRFMLPYWNPYTKDGKIAKSDSKDWKGTSVNPIEWIMANPMEHKKYKALSSMFVEIVPVEGLTWKSTFGIDYTHGTTDMKSRPSFSGNNGIGRAGKSSYDTVNLTITNTLNYLWDMDDDNHFTFLLGQEGVNNSQEQFQVVTRGQNNDFLTNLSAATDATSWGVSKSAYAYLSFFGRAEYNYQGKYYLDGSIRSDASSRFGKDGRWATFWSVGGMWDILGEQWMAGTRSVLTRMQIALSTGTSGNSSIPNYDHLALVGGGAIYDGESGIYPMQQGNPKLRWEKLWSNNLAIHSSLWSKLNLNVELYYKRTTDMLMAVPQSYSQTGASSRWDNVGEMVNKGIEISADATVFQRGDLLISVNATASYNKNEIKELYNGLDEYEMSGTNTKLVVGHSVGEFYINRFAGVNPANGDALWLTKEGALTTEYKESDKVMIGKNYIAPWQGGFGFSAMWKGLVLATQWSWVYDRWMINNDRYFEESNGLYSVYNQSKRMLYDRWKQPGDVKDIPRYGVAPQMDSHLLEDASFLRLKNVSLSYSFPSEMLKKTNFFSSARVSFQAQNLLTFTKFSGLDPESSANVYKAQYPMTKQFTIGAEFTF